MSAFQLLSLLLFLANSLTIIPLLGHFGYLENAMRRAFSITFMILLLLLIPLGIEFFGLPISGTEFSAQTFTLRKFSYQRSPLTHKIRSKRALTTIELGCPSLIALNLIPPPSNIPQRWDLVSESVQQNDVLSHEFDARFLTSYLDWKTEQWNTENVAKAELFWPAITELARAEQYLQIPPLFEFALNEPEDLSDEDFEEKLNLRLAKAWFEAGTLSEATSDSENADQDAAVFFEKSNALDPDLKSKVRLEK